MKKETVERLRKALIQLTVCVIIFHLLILGIVLIAPNEKLVPFADGPFLHKQVEKAEIAEKRYNDRMSDIMNFRIACDWIYADTIMDNEQRYSAKTEKENRYNCRYVTHYIDIKNEFAGKKIDYNEIMKRESESILLDDARFNVFGTLAIYTLSALIICILFLLFVLQPKISK